MATNERIRGHKHMQDHLARFLLDDPSPEYLSGMAIAIEAYGLWIESWKRSALERKHD